MNVHLKFSILWLSTLKKKNASPSSLFKNQIFTPDLLMWILKVNVLNFQNENITKFTTPKKED